MIASLVPPSGDLATTQACALTGNQTSDPLVHRLVLNPLRHTSQGYFKFLKEIKSSRTGQYVGKSVLCGDNFPYILLTSLKGIRLYKTKVKHCIISFLYKYNTYNNITRIGKGKEIYWTNLFIFF